MYYTIKFNRSKKTYTFREYYDNGKFFSKYRSYPQGKDYSEDWSQDDIINYLYYSDYDYYLVK